VTGISILGPPEVAPGTSATFSAVETLSNGTNRPVTQPVQFTSSDTAVLTIDNSGLAVALKVGETTLSVRTASQPGGMLPVMVLPPGTYRLRGTVWADNDSIWPGALVDIPAVGLSRITDGQGAFVFYGVPSEADLVVTADEAYPCSKHVRLTNHQSRIDIILAVRRPPAPPPTFWVC
jgi:hypothetical protein